ncbi:lipid A-modifier LpxR family protein [Caulobacter soli]|uniref:lipid A-modifier LpxR family protein n=1 Tax=Caulobacter soli TaxID=2708539 RepID=UPI0013ED5D5F|nr:lipid A-modifier LpxR family protein [Caulobacter soli]
MRACTAFFAGVGLSVLAIATAQAQPTRSAPSSSPADKASVATRKAPPSFIVASQADPVDFSVRNVRPAEASVGFTEAPAARTERAEDPSFALSPAGAYGDAALLDSNRYYQGRGAVNYRSSAMVVGEGERAVDSVRVSVASVAPFGQTRPLALVRPDEDSFQDRDVDVTVTRGWPAAVSVGKGKYALDVTPHAGLGFGGAGGSAEAGATVRFGKKMGDQVVNSLGVRDGREFGQRGRWYVFAAASGQAVGLNMLRGGDGDWSRAGFTTDTSSKLVGDGQAGVAWRKGAMQASFGYVHRSIKAKDQIMGMATQKDEMVALSFSLRPHW